MAILSLQSQVVNGMVGNAAAAFILARLGHEVWAVPTTLLSHHPGHGGAEGGPIAPSHLAKLIEGLSYRGAFARCEAVLSGYLGSPSVVPVVLDAIARARAAHPGALFACDPVIGDAGRIYVTPPLIGAFRDVLLPLADIAFPNPFELATLLGDIPTTRAAAFGMMATLGPKLVILTGFAGADTPTGCLDLLLRSGPLRHVATVQRLERGFSGAGDAFAALFMAGYLPRRDPIAALEHATCALAKLLRATERRGSDELSVIEAQDEWALLSPR